MNKRGLSAVITTLLIIVLVLVAVGIVWGVIRNIVRRGAEGIEISAKCLNIDVTAVSADCSDTSTCSVVVERSGSGTDEIAGIKVVVRDSLTGETSVTDSPGNLVSLNTRIVSANSTGVTTPDTVEVTAYFEDASGNEQICSQTISSNVGSGGDDGGDACDPVCEDPTPHCLIDECVECIDSTDCGVDESCTNNVCVGTLEESIVFVSSTEIYTGNLGGIIGADIICNNLASAAGLPGTFVAWLSDSTTNAKDRISADIPFNRTDGEPIADSLADLLDNELPYQINRDEAGVDLGSGHAWTGTTGTGVVEDNEHCSDWTSDSGTGRKGEIHRLDNRWTYHRIENCDRNRRLYCFQVS